MFLFGAAKRYVRHLENEILWYREQLLLERRRAEDAVNIKIAHQGIQGALTVTAPPQPADDPIQRLMRDTEFSTVGSME